MTIAFVVISFWCIFINSSVDNLWFVDVGHFLLLLMFLGFISTWHGLYGSCYFIYCVHMYIYFVCRNYTTSEKVGTRVWAVISNFCNLLYYCDILHDYFSVNFHQTCKLSYQWNITGLITHLGYCFSAGHAVGCSSGARFSKNLKIFLSFS